MFVATFVSNCPRKWPQLLPVTVPTHAAHPPAIFGFFIAKQSPHQEEKRIFEDQHDKVEFKDWELKRVVVEFST